MEIETTENIKEISESNLEQQKYLSLLLGIKLFKKI